MYLRMQGMPWLTFVKEMYPVHAFHNIDFCRSIEKQECEQSEGLAALVDLVLTHLSFNIRRARDEKNYKHEILASADMKVVAKLCSYMVWHGSHVKILCSPLHFEL